MALEVFHVAHAKAGSSSAVSVSVVKLTKWFSNQPELKGLRAAGRGQFDWVWFLKSNKGNSGSPRGSDYRESAYNVGDPGLIPGLGRSLGEMNGYPLQYSCLEKSKN